MARYAERRQRDGDERASDPLRLLMAEERRQWVCEALQRLPARDAEILLLKYTEHWSYHELSEHLGISESAVDSRLHRARERLRSELDGHEINEELR